MAKGYKRRYYHGNRDKYSVEQTFFNTSLTSGQTTAIDVVPAAAIQGMRKVKHITITAASATTVTDGVLWCLFYLPAGYAAPAFNVTTGSPLIEPNQYVMNCGCFDHDAGPFRVTSRLSRNLNSGDRIVLLLRPLNTSAASEITGIVRYAITLQ